MTDTSVLDEGSAHLAFQASTPLFTRGEKRYTKGAAQHSFQLGSGATPHLASDEWKRRLSGKTSLSGWLRHDTPPSWKSISRFVPLYLLAIKRIITECELSVQGASPTVTEGSVSTKAFEGNPPDVDADTVCSKKTAPSFFSGQKSEYCHTASSSGIIVFPLESSVLSSDFSAPFISGASSPLWSHEAMQTFLSNLNELVNLQDSAPLVFTVALVYLSRIARRSTGEDDMVTVQNWFRLTTISILLAFKMYADSDEVYYANRCFAAAAGMTLQEANHLELDFLYLIDFDLFIEERDVMVWLLWTEALAHQNGFATPFQAFMVSSQADVEFPYPRDSLSTVAGGSTVTGVPNNDAGLSATPYCFDPSKKDSLDRYGTAHSTDGPSSSHGCGGSRLDEAAECAASSSVLRGLFPVQEVSAAAPGGQRLFSLIHECSDDYRASSVSVRLLSQMGDSPVAPPRPPSPPAFKLSKHQKPGIRRELHEQPSAAKREQLPQQPPAERDANTKESMDSTAIDATTQPLPTGSVRGLVGRFKEAVNLTLSIARGRLNVLSPVSKPRGQLKSDLRTPIGSSYPPAAPPIAPGFANHAQQRLVYSDEELDAAAPHECVAARGEVGSLDERPPSGRLTPDCPYEVGQYDTAEGYWEEDSLYHSDSDYDGFYDDDDDDDFVCAKQPPRTHSPPAF